MTDEPDNTPPVEDVTDNVALSEDDNSETFDYFDPDEDNEEIEAEQGTEDEADEVEAQDEAEDQEAEEPQDDAATDTVKVQMDDGTELTVSELKGGYMRQADYSRKTQEASNMKADLTANTERMQGVIDAFVNHLSKLVPDAPDLSLAMTDSNAYTAQEAQHKAAMAQVEQLIKMGETPKEIAGKLEGDGLLQAQKEANDRLVQMFPETSGGESRKAFFDDVGAVAQGLGFTSQELSQLSDHRVFALAHYAGLGMKAEKAKAKAKVKIANAPPATPRKPGGAQKSGNAEAMRKLSQSGSLQDAMAVDWD